MVKRYVSDTNAAKGASAYVIMKGSRHVATVTAAFGSGGGCLVNVRQSDAEATRSAKAYNRDSENKGPSRYADDFYFQWAKTGGYGYDKFTAALSGMYIDGHRMTDHCGGRLPLPKGAKVFPRDFKAPKGYSVANFVSERNCEARGLPAGTEGYTDCYKQSGLDYLKGLGYTVIQAI